MGDAGKREDLTMNEIKDNSEELLIWVSVVMHWKDNVE